MINHLSRRHFLRQVSTGAAGLGLAAGVASARAPQSTSMEEKPALLGGKPVRTEPFPSWPVIKENDERGWMEVLRKKLWSRNVGGPYDKQFEETWASMLGAKYCLATSSGTNALYTSLNALGVGPGDEVIVPPYTFIATINVVLLQYALPVFVDTDPETFQIDARKIEAAITPRTRCILPVHLGGSAANLDVILEVAKKHKLPVLEDTCQSHLAEWRGRKLSTLGDLGCFSFQGTKNLPCGEGGAILTNDLQLYQYCLSFHNQGRDTSRTFLGSIRRGSNVRMAEPLGEMLLEQMKRLEEQTRTREQNAKYLTSLLREIPGIGPAHMYEGCTRNAYHLYMLHYDKANFADLPRARFLKALEAEGIPCAGGYTPLNKEPFLKNTLESRGYRAIYSPKELVEYGERNNCPVNDKLCEEAVWMFQNMLLGSRTDMDQIASAVRKIHNHAAALAKS